MPHAPAVLDDNEWGALYAAFARSDYRQVIEQLCASDNGPIGASELFAGLDVERGEEFVDHLLRERKFPYRLKRVSEKQGSERELALCDS